MYLQEREAKKGEKHFHHPMSFMQRSAHTAFCSHGRACSFRSFPRFAGSGRADRLALAFSDRYRESGGQSCPGFLARAGENRAHCHPGLALSVLSVPLRHCDPRGKYAGRDQGMIAGH